MRAGDRARMTQIYVYYLSIYPDLHIPVTLCVIQYSSCVSNLVMLPGVGSQASFHGGCFFFYLEHSHEFHGTWIHRQRGTIAHFPHNLHEITKTGSDVQRIHDHKRATCIKWV